MRYLTVGITVISIALCFSCQRESGNEKYRVKFRVHNQTDRLFKPFSIKGEGFPEDMVKCVPNARTLMAYSVAEFASEVEVAWVDLGNNYWVRYKMPDFVIENNIEVKLTFIDSALPSLRVTLADGSELKADILDSSEEKSEEGTANGPP